MRRAILQDGTDYSVIPGTQKPTLLKPGAEKLLMAAGLGFTIERIPEPGTDARQGVTYRTTIRRGDDIVAQCDGYAGYDEDRFYQASAQRRIEAERRERSNAAKYQRAVNSKKWEDLPEEDYCAPWNSVMKMAEKRSLVGAVLNALAASGLFTQDLEDMPDGGDLSWDVGELLRPWLQEVYKVDGAREELRDWTSSNNYPERPKDFNQTQATALLVHIGTILARRQQTSAVEGGDHPSPPTTAEEVSTPPGSESAPQSRDEDGVEHVARDGASEPTVAATPSEEAPKAGSAPIHTSEATNQAALTATAPATGDEVPEGFVSWHYARSLLAGHAATTGNPAAKTPQAATELAEFALASHGLGPVSRDDLDKMLKRVEPAEGDDEFAPSESPSTLAERAANIADTQRRSRPAPRQMGLVD